jgi:ribonuclease BN (tRNA processing enzyme)
MRITVLGGTGAFPTAEAGCSGYVVEHHGFVLVVDPGYATVSALLQRWTAEQVDAVFVTHGHPDHCADLHALLRARAFGPGATSLPLYAPPGALERILALDSPAMLNEAYVRHDVMPGERITIGPLTVDTIPLPHMMPNTAVRLSAGGRSFVYTGDGGPEPALTPFATGAELLLAEATYADAVPPRQAGLLSTAREMGRVAAAAGVGALWLTHLWPTADPVAHLEAAAQAYAGPLDIARPGLTLDL